MSDSKPQVIPSKQAGVAELINPGTQDDQIDLTTTTMAELARYHHCLSLKIIKLKNISIHLNGKIERSTDSLQIRVFRMTQNFAEENQGTMMESIAAIEKMLLQPGEATELDYQILKKGLKLLHDLNTLQ